MPNKKATETEKRIQSTDGNPRASAEKAVGGKASPNTAKGGKKTDGRDKLLKEESREFYENGLREQLSELDEQISELEFSMETSGWDPMSDYHKLTDDIHVLLAEAREKVDSLESAEDAEWGGLYREAQEAIQSLGDLYVKVSEAIEGMLPE